VKSLFSFLWKAALSLAVSVLVYLAWVYVSKLAESYQLVVATWVMAGFTIILAVFAILQGIATWKHLKTFREAQTWDRLREHSGKLIPILGQWIQCIANASPGELNIEHGNAAFSTLTKPSLKYTPMHALLEHLKTGYKEDMKAWERLEREFEDHRNSSKNFFDMLNDELKQRVRLPSHYSGKEPEEWFNSLRCAEIVYSILIGKLEAEYYLKDNPPKIESYRSGYAMEWPPGITIARTNQTECVVIQEAITDLIKDPKMIKEGHRLLETARKIGGDLKSSLDQLQTLIGIIELGGILEGNCVYCQRLRLK